MSEEFEEALSSIKGEVPDGSEYACLSMLHVKNPLADALQKLDPFSSIYRETAMRLYQSLRRSADVYDPQLHELSLMDGLPADLWRGVTPWSFNDPALVGEMLICWGNIMRLLDLSPGTSVIEYGSGSGQLAIALARAGADVHCVDIDQASLNIVSAQAAQMGLPVKCEQAPFGEGFGEATFDRIVFFEAFHHAWDFENLLDRLAARLKPGGFILLCGEPVVSSATPAVPFAWGPRLDGLSVFCMRKFGWMELGFSHEFFIELFRRRGWLVSEHHIPGLFRASTYIAKRAAGTVVNLGRHDAISATHESGWSGAEGTHRWTTGGMASFPIPSVTDVTIRMINMLNVEKIVTISSGDSLKRVDIAPGAESTVTLRRPNGRTIDIQSDVHRPRDIIPGSTDDRLLGIAVKAIEFS